VKRFKIIAPPLIFFIACFVGGLGLFFPLQEAVDWGVALLIREGDRRGIEITVRNATAGGGWIPSLTLESIEGRSPLFSARSRGVELRWNPLPLLGGRGAFVLSWEEGGVEAFGKEASWEGGQTQVELTPGTGRFLALELRGELQARGDATLDLVASRISAADMRLKVPGELDGVLEAAAAFLPLQKESEGQWHLVREEGHDAPQS